MKQVSNLIRFSTVIKEWAKIISFLIYQYFCYEGNEIDISNLRNSRSNQLSQVSGVSNFYKLLFILWPDKNKNIIRTLSSATVCLK